MCIYVQHDGWVQALSFSSDGLYLASASDDESVRVWDVLTGECIKVLEVTNL
jgi:WD40 repeat protein